MHPRRNRHGQIANALKQLNKKVIDFQEPASAKRRISWMSGAAPSLKPTSRGTSSEQFKAMAADDSVYG